MMDTSVETKSDNFLLNDARFIPKNNSQNFEAIQKPIMNLIEAKIGIADFIILMMIWGLSLIASVKSLGYFGSGIFFVLSVTLVIKKPENGLMILLLLFYSPALALQIPSIFVVSSLITIFGYIIHGNFLRIFKLIQTNFLIISLIFLAWSLLSTLFSANFDIAVKYWMQYLHGLLMLLLLMIGIRSPEDCGKILKWWTILAALTLIVSMVHYFLGEDTFLYAILKNIKRAGGYTAVTSMTIGIGYNEIVGRLIWPGVGPNYHSANLVFPFGIALAFYNASKPSQKIFWLVIVIMIGSAVVGTFSRSGFLSICIVAAAFLIQKNIRAIIPIITLGGVVAALVIFLPQLILRVGSIEGALVRGATGRFTAWWLAFEMWLSSPIFGTGLGSFFAEYHTVAHNTYLTVLCETGLIGFLLYLFVIVLSFFKCLNIRKIYSSINPIESSFIKTMEIALAGMCLMIATISYEEVKLFWMACGICGCIYMVVREEIKKITH